MYIVNRHNHYFWVTKSCPIDMSKLTRCIVFDSIEGMYDYVTKATGLSIDEVWEGGIRIRKLHEGYEEADIRGIRTKFDCDSLEDYVSHYVL